MFQTKISRKEQEDLAVALKEKERRYQRKIQSGRGGLLNFVRFFWSVLEPATQFVEGWVFEAICLHLEAVTFGDINRLLINVSPGASKSLLTQVFWPAWEWSAMGRPSTRYVTFSYSAYLTERDNDRFCKLIQSERFRDLWGDQFNVTAEGKVKIANNKTGWKFASSVGGVGTGERGDRVVCFPADEIVQTEIGPMPIGEIVEQRANLQVWSLNETTGCMELQPIVGWHKNPGRQLLKITVEDGSSVTCTDDHKIYSTRGKISASAILVGDRLLAFDGGMHSAALPISPKERKVEVFPSPSETDICNSSHANAELSGKNPERIIVSGGNFTNNFIRKVRGAISKRSMSLTIRDVLRSRAVLKVARPAFRPIAIFMTHLLSFRARSQEGFGNQLVVHAGISKSNSAKINVRVSLAGTRLQDSSGDFHREAVSCSGTREALTPTHVGDHISGEADNRLPHFIQVISIDRVHDIPQHTFCITVQKNHNLCCGELSNIICANCDDPHNLVDAESTIVREDTCRWFEESAQNRLNDLSRSAIVIIMQRLNEGDISGLVLEKFSRFCHLCIPMEYERDRHCITEIGWEDPRTIEGELAWPERFPANVLVEFKTNEYLWAGQYQQRPQLRGSAILKAEYWQPWDEESSVENGVKYGLYPPFEYVVGCLDTAMTEKKQNDPSAFLALGVWRNKNNNRRIMLIYAWTERFEFHDLINQIVRACKKCKISLDKLLVEAKANGHSVEQELRRLHQDSSYEAGNPLALTSIQLWNPGRGDKVSRAMAIQPIMERRVVYYPTRTDEAGNIIPRAWAKAVETQASSFPRGKHDDLVDCLTMGLAHLRLIGMIATPEEEREILRQELSDYRTPLPLYPGA